MAEVRKTSHHSHWGSGQEAAHGRSTSERGPLSEKEVLRTAPEQTRSFLSWTGLCTRGRSSGKNHPGPDGRAGNLSEVHTVSEMQVASRGGRSGTSE